MQAISVTHNLLLQHACNIVKVLHAEGMPATSADILSGEKVHCIINYNLLMFIEIGSQEHWWHGQRI